MAIKPVKRNMTIIQGADLDLIFTWRAAGAPVNLTGCTARLQVRSDIDSIVLLELTTENGGIQLGGATGTVRRYMNPAATAAIVPWEEAVYDLEIMFPSGSVRRLLAGNATVSREVTRNAP